jgi:hypothetical protein
MDSKILPVQNQRFVVTIGANRYIIVAAGRNNAEIVR